MTMFLQGAVYKYCISCTQKIQNGMQKILRTENTAAGAKLKQALPCSIFYACYQQDRAEICLLLSI